MLQEKAQKICSQNAHCDQKTFLQIRSKKQTIFIQSTQTNYEYGTPIGHPQFTYPEIDYLSIIASPSHEGHVPFKKNQEIYTI